MITITELMNRKKMWNGSLGIYAQMVCVPSDDYKTFEEICSFSGVQTPERIKETKEYLDELVEQEFLIHPDEEQKIYAVNKEKLFETQGL